MSLRIDRCFCFAQTFADLADVAEATGAETVAGLQEHALFGQKCALCHPYVRRMLRTGETVFDRVVTEADEPKAGASRPHAGTGQPPRPARAGGVAEPGGAA